MTLRTCNTNAKAEVSIFDEHACQQAQRYIEGVPKRLTEAASLQLTSFKRKVAVLDMSPMGQTKVCNADSNDSALTKLKAKIQSCNASLLPMPLAFHKQGSKALKPTAPVSCMPATMQQGSGWWSADPCHPWEPSLHSQQHPAQTKQTTHVHILP